LLAACLSIWLFNNASTSWQGVVKCCAHTLVQVCKHSTASPTQFRQWARSKLPTPNLPSPPLPTRSVGLLTLLTRQIRVGILMSIRIRSRMSVLICSRTGTSCLKCPNITLYWTRPGALPGLGVYFLFWR